MKQVMKQDEILASWSGNCAGSGQPLGSTTVDLRHHPVTHLLLALDQGQAPIISGDYATTQQGLNHTTTCLVLPM